MDFDLILSEIIIFLNFVGSGPNGENFGFELTDWFLIRQGNYLNFKVQTLVNYFFHKTLTNLELEIINSNYCLFEEW